MRLTSIETVRFVQHANLLILKLGTDSGLVGLGETYFAPGAVEAYVHEAIAPAILGREGDRISLLTEELTPYVGYQSSGAEVRAISAVNIALWDVLGRMCGQPVYQLLGGRVRDEVPVYNTCAGSNYVQGPEGQSMANWGITGVHEEAPYEDLRAFLTRPGELATELLEQGYRGMKIWPFDAYAERGGGYALESSDLKAALGIIESIREAVGDRLDVMVEMHGLWAQQGAQRVVGALADLEIAWVEDAVRSDRSEALARLTAESAIPIAGGETLAGAASYRRLLSAGALDIPIVDPTWTGGLSEAVRVVQLAETYGASAAAHDCTGPISLAVCAHLAVSQPNVFVQEIVRAFYYGWYQDLVTSLPRLVDGRLAPLDEPGLGVDLQPGLEDRPGVRVRRSEL